MANTALKLINLLTGEEKHKIGTIRDAIKNASQSLQDLEQQCMDSTFAPKENDICDAIKHLDEGVAGFKVLEHMLSKLPTMPLNWQCRCQKLPRSISDWMPKDCSGILSATSLIRIINTWEIYENQDETRQYILKEDMIPNSKNQYMSSIIKDMQIEIPVYPSIEYHNMVAILDSDICDSVSISFEKNNNNTKWVAAIPNIIWTRSEYLNKLHISLSFTAPKDIIQKIGLMEVIYKFNNVILNTKLTGLLTFIISTIKIKRTKNTAEWHVTKKLQHNDYDDDDCYSDDGHDDEKNHMIPYILNK